MSTKSNNVQNANVSPRLNYLLNEKTPFDVMEAFRNIKATLSVSIPKSKEGGAVIMVTSALPNDGKTTVSVNLALMFALSDAKVVLIDGDIRKGRVAKFFKQKKEPGLSNYLAGQVSLDRMIHQSKINDNLSYITCGTNSPRPYELLESAEMKTLVQTLRAQFDYVIIDTSPVLVVSDALALSDLADGAVLVCRHLHSNTDDIERAVKTLRFAKTNLLGLVVNDYKGEKHGKYGYGSYDYSYAYGKQSAYNLGSSAKGATTKATETSKTSDSEEKTEK